MTPFSRIQGRTGILRSLGKRPRSVAEFTNFFVERVDKPTDNKSSRCFATATDAHPHADGNGDLSFIGPDVPLRLGATPVAPPNCNQWS
jgi:hypothetical protein